MMPTRIQRQLRALEHALRTARRRQPFRASTWAADVPSEPGVYALWNRKTGVPVYVGETSSLKHRMRDFGRSVNHTCRRKLAQRHGLDGADEATLSAAIGGHYRLSFLRVPFGRAELEEYLLVRWRKTLLNSPTPRASISERFTWAL